MASGGGSDKTSTGAMTAASRSSMPSSGVATANQVAPPSSAARATATAPWPYPSALTTAHRAAGAAT